MLRKFLLLTTFLAAAPLAFGEPLVPHPGLGRAVDANWANQLGSFGESLARELHRVRGFEVYDLNLGRNGVDVLVQATGADGKVEFRVVEVKTRTESFTLKVVEQMQHEHVLDRLEKSAARHADDATRRVAAAALEQARAGKLLHELHAIAVNDDLYQIYRVDPSTGQVSPEPVAKYKLTETLDELARKASTPVNRQVARAQLEAMERLRSTSTPTGNKSPSAPVAKGAKATPPVNKTLKWVGRGAAIVGAAVEIYDRSSRAIETERQFQEDKLTDPERVTAHAKNVAGGAGGTAGAFGGAWALGSAGASLGTVAGPWGITIGAGIGTVAGGVLGYMGGQEAAEQVAEAAKDWLYERVQEARQVGGWARSAWRSLVD